MRGCYGMNEFNHMHNVDQKNLLGCKPEDRSNRCVSWDCEFVSIRERKTLQTLDSFSAMIWLAHHVLDTQCYYYTVGFRNQMEGLQWAAQVWSSPQERQVQQTAQIQPTRFEVDQPWGMSAVICNNTVWSANSAVMSPPLATTLLRFGGSYAEAITLQHDEVCYLVYVWYNVLFILDRVFMFSTGLTWRSN